MKCVCFLLLLIVIEAAGFAFLLMVLTYSDVVEITGERNPYICVSWTEKHKQDKNAGINYKWNNLKDRIE